MLVGGLCWVCYPQPPCHSELCLHVDTVCVEQTCPHVPKGFHSYPTHYMIQYSQADLDWNMTRANIRASLTGFQ